MYGGDFCVSCENETRSEPVFWFVCCQPYQNSSCSYLILSACSHYFINGGFLESDTQLLDRVDTVRHIPATIVQGRYDVICPAATAWELHKVSPVLLWFMGEMNLCIKKCNESLDFYI